MSTNEKLMKLPIYKNAKCVLCGAGTDEAILNIEGSIHHNSQIICIDQKACKHGQRKQDKRQLRKVDNRQSKPL